jgi:O-antigen/teichoic acid export membrane protein
MRGGFVLGTGHVMGTLIGFFLSLIFANFVESTVYGQYKYIASIAGILGAFTLSGVSTTIVQSVAKGYDGALFAEQKLYLKWSLLSVIGSCVVGGYYIFKDDLILGVGIVLATALNYLYNFLILHSAFLSGKKDFARLSVNQTLNATALLVSVGAALWFGFNTTLWIILIYYGSQILFQIFAYTNTLRIYKPSSVVDTNDKNFSKHVSLGNAITFIAEYIDKILIFQFFGAYQVALYAFAVGIPDQIRGINKLMSSLVVPKLSDKDDVGLQKSVRAHTRKYTIVATLIVVLFYFISPYVYTFFFPVYKDAAVLASLYILLLPITAICTMHGYAIQIRRDVKSLYVIKTVDSVGKILLFIVLIPWLGVLGAILSILISKSFTALVQIGLYHHRSRQ